MRLAPFPPVANAPTGADVSRDNRPHDKCPYDVCGFKVIKLNILYDIISPVTYTLSCPAQQRHEADRRPATAFESLLPARDAQQLLPALGTGRHDQPAADRELR